jgi:hypothetical protein
VGGGCGGGAWFIHQLEVGNAATMDFIDPPHLPQPLVAPTGRSSCGQDSHLSPLRTGLPGNSTVSGRCRSKFNPKARRDDRTLNSRSSSSPNAGL